MVAAEELAAEVGVAPACRAIGVARSSLYRHRRRRREPAPARRPRSAPPRTLEAEERDAVLEVLHSERFLDRSPAQVVATLLDEGTYLCSERTMYRILAEEDEVRDRRDQLRHPNYVKPQLLATAPNEVWSWDITKLLGPAKWVYFYLYVILDIFSRYVVGWMVAERESGALARTLIEQTCRKQGIERNQLTIHADRGSSMRCKEVCQLLADLGVVRTHTRPYTASDNPYSESQLKTMKYGPEFPGRFDGARQAVEFCRVFFPFYNTEHRHSGIGYLTPEMVHYGHAEAILRDRQRVLEDAYLAHPERFVHGMSTVAALPEAVWINPPEPGGASD